MKAKITAKPAKNLLAPENSVLLLVDYQPQMFFGVQSIDRETLINNVVGLAKAAKAFRVPVILTTIAAESFSGPNLAQLEEVFPEITPIDRTNMNAWEDERVVAAIEKTGRKNLVIAGLWTEVCAAYPALSALEAGYDVYVVADACGDVSELAHETAMERMIKAGATPVTWLQVLLEFQRDWSRAKTYDAVLEIIKEHGGAYGIGVVYAQSIIGKHAKAA